MDNSIAKLLCLQQPYAKIFRVQHGAMDLVFDPNVMAVAGVHANSDSGIPLGRRCGRIGETHADFVSAIRVGECFPPSG